MTQERWQKLSPHDQLRNIAAEIERARVSDEGGDADLFRSALERALELVDLSLADPRWRHDALKLFVLRNEVARRYAGESREGMSVLSSVL